MITNFSTTPSIAIPAIRNLPPPPISTADEPDLEYPPLDNDWKVESLNKTPAIPISPPQHHIHPNIITHLQTLHIVLNYEYMVIQTEHNIIRPNCKPMTPTNPVPSMPSSLLQFLQADP